MTTAPDTPVFDRLLSEVLHEARVAEQRLATVRAGLDRLHAPDQHERCPLCREAWPCATRRLVDGVFRGDLDAAAVERLIDTARVHDPPHRYGDVASAVPGLSGLAGLLDTARRSRALDLLRGHGRP